MNYKDLTDRTLRWMIDVGIKESGDIKTQYMKSMEEFGELLIAYKENNPFELKDALGDLQVTLILLCEMKGVDFYDIFMTVKSKYPQKQSRGYELLASMTYILTRISQCIIKDKVLEFDLWIERICINLLQFSTFEELESSLGVALAEIEGRVGKGEMKNGSFVKAGDL
jgi:NTP pyrophosphatase (non-canonical NTP hydrolase)